MIPIAFYAPLKSPGHSVPSGDRTMARLLLSALRRAGFDPLLASELRSLDVHGDPEHQRDVRRDAEIEAERLVAHYLGQPPERRPRLWFTYHCHYKAPDWIGPRVARALGIGYAVAEGSRSARRAQGPWAIGHAGAEAALDFADRLFVMTPYDAEDLEPALRPGQQLVTLPPFLDASAWTTRETRGPITDASPARLLTVAMMRPGDKSSSYRLLAEALAFLPAGARWTLDVVGDGPTRDDIEALFRPFGEQVRFRGALDHAALAAAYGEADLFVWPAVGEAYGMTFLEAQACGCPILAGREGGVPAVLREGETGLLAARRDAGAFAAALSGLLAEPARLRRMGGAARRFVRDERDLPQAADILRESLLPLGTSRHLRGMRGEALRILIAVTHLVGAGHLMRASAIGRALARRGHHVTLVSGGMPLALADIEGLELVQLPPVRSPLDSYSTLLESDGTPASALYLDRRRQELLLAYSRAQPDVVITEQFPFGRRSLAGEFRVLLDAAEADRRHPLLLGSVRDILVVPAKAEKIERTHALVARRYRAILVHGDEAIVPLDRSWPVDESLRRKLIYTGYVGPEAGQDVAPPQESDGTILVSGGSSAAGLPVYRAALAAARDSPTRPWRILVGPAVEEVLFQELLREAPPNAVVERARRDFRALLAQAAVFVGQAGYNTVMDIAVTRARSVLVPFEQGQETEQRLRAEGLAASGLATMLPEAELTPATLLAAAEHARTLARPAFAFRTDGQERSAEIIEDLAARFVGGEPGGLGEQ